MAMEINKVFYFIALTDEIGDHLLDGRDYRVKVLVDCLVPLSIDV